jgi:hypothetical protein
LRRTGLSTELRQRTTPRFAGVGGGGCCEPSSAELVSRYPTPGTCRIPGVDGFARTGRGGTALIHRSHGSSPLAGDGPARHAGPWRAALRRGASVDCAVLPLRESLLTRARAYRSDRWRHGSTGNCVRHSPSRWRRVDIFSRDEGHPYSARRNATRSRFSSFVIWSWRIRLKNSTVSSRVGSRPS